MKVYETANSWAFISKHNQLCHVWVLLYSPDSQSLVLRSLKGRSRVCRLLITLLASAASSDAPTTENTRAHPQQLWIKTRFTCPFHLLWFLLQKCLFVSLLKKGTKLLYVNEFLLSEKPLTLLSIHSVHPRLYLIFSHWVHTHINRLFPRTGTCTWKHTHVQTASSPHTKLPSVLTEAHSWQEWKAQQWKSFNNEDHGP